MRRFAALILVAGCSTAPARVEGDRAYLENPHLKVVFLPDGALVSFARAGKWQPAALLRGRKFQSPRVEESAIRFDGARFSLSGRQVRFETDREILVEVLGKRSMALFPGLELLEGDEPSSSERDIHGPEADRRRPDPTKITVPLMAYAVEGSLVALLWKEPRPVFFEAREKNLMGISGSAILHVEDGTTIYEAVPRWIELFGLPSPEPWPRSLEEEIALCREGFRTVATPEGKHRHCVGWEPAWTPGFAVLLELTGEKVDWGVYPDLLSSANCHILRWEAPFHAGKPELLKNLVAPIKELARRRDGTEWGFEPADEKQERLGKKGDKVLGTSARNALSLAKAARMTGNDELEFIALETLRSLRRYRVPQGAQGWECPIRAPDLLAAAYAVGAYVEAYKLSADERYLEEAVRWAKAGLPFVYLWRLPDRPLMLYATLPIFGATHFTQSWLGVPVQWNGLVYAYYLRKLAPLDKGFDWTRVADGILASAVHQQYADGPSKGCYPDAVLDTFTRRSPADINPENILVNILASQGKDPDPDLKLGK